MSVKSFALVTGAGSGIGAAVAKRLDEVGYQVGLVGRRKANLEKVAELLTHSPRIYPLDLQKPEACDGLAAEMINEKIPLKVIVHNAGIIYRKPFEETSPTEWLETFQTNLFAPVQLTRSLFEWLKEQGGASIVNVSSTLGLHPVPDTSAYSASKAAMVNWTKTLALEGAPFKIRANCVCPGIVDTPIHRFEDQDKEEARKMREAYGEIHPLGRMGKPEEVAHSIVHFCVEGSEWTTGSVMTVDGGIRLI